MGADGDSVRLVRESPAASPYATMRYEIVDRGAPTAVQRKTLPGHSESLHAMRLLTREKAERFFDDVISWAGNGLVDAIEPTVGVDTTVWRVEIRVRGLEQAFRVRDPLNQKDTRYGKIVRRLRALVDASTGELPFRNIFYPPQVLGWVNIRAVPQASVVIDGFDTRLKTPLYGYELKAGTHVVRLGSVDGKIQREYTIRVDPGGTTHLAVDLR